ncbi:MAG: imelysin family protein [Flavobacteriales bacterium]|nr:imelysin family protein [Flavobacteriales bacterium]
MKKQTSFILLALAFSTLITVLYSCKKDKDDPDEVEFDRKAMLANMGNQVIVPAYADWLDATNTLDSLVIDFTGAPDSSRLIALRQAFKDVYVSWQYVSPFEFGPAEQVLLRTNINTFPTDTTQISANISAGTYDLSATANLDAKGFPALDFLLFGTGKTVQEMISLYTTDPQAANRITYLKDLSMEIHTLASQVYDQWTGSGNYLNTFTSNDGTSVGSSTGLLVNQLNYDFEILKNYEIGIPSGKMSLGTPLPEKVQGYYSGFSMDLAQAHLSAFESIYLGKGNAGTNGLGLDDYLTLLKANYNGSMLSDAIQAQINKARTALAAIPDPLSDAVVNQSATVDAAYTELQKLLVLFKTDMPSALGILITYQDNDGD